MKGGGKAVGGGGGGGGEKVNPTPLLDLWRYGGIMVSGLAP